MKDLASTTWRNRKRQKCFKPLRRGLATQSLLVYFLMHSLRLNRMWCSTLCKGQTWWTASTPGLKCPSGIVGTTAVPSGTQMTSSSIWRQACLLSACQCLWLQILILQMGWASHTLERNFHFHHAFKAFNFMASTDSIYKSCAIFNFGSASLSAYKKSLEATLGSLL